MTHTRLSQQILLLVSLLASPFVIAADENASEAAKVCIDTTRVRNFDPISDDFLFIEERTNQFYLITMRNSCFDLRNARAIAFTENLRRVCSGDNFADIVISSMGRPMSCRIGDLEKVENKQAAVAIAEERKAAKDAAKTDK